mmetsp:Transcript_31910/g.81189  ORF Transcript_31910/g.81189 Transcript_31910/m.81189 type:complete len:205 (-) Transcript_31910:2233-2847(-)
MGDMPGLDASFSSMAMILVMPSIIFCTSWTSVKPMRCLLLMSHLAPTAAECSPEDPRGWRSNSLQISSSMWGSLLSSGSLIMTEARSPVPRLEGQVPRNPRRSLSISLAPLETAAALIVSLILQKRAKTDQTSPPFCIEMMRQWSSSLHHASAVLASLWKMPLLSGQLRAAPATARSCAGPGFWKRKPLDWSMSSSALERAPRG